MATRQPIPLPKFSAKDIARYWKKVDRGRSDECWPWKASKRGGYGQFSFGPAAQNQMFPAHRIAYWLGHGQDAAPLDVLHLCDFPPCQNPAHLFTGTPADNIHDAQAKGRMQIGDTGYWRMHPERVPRGERNGVSKLTASDIVEIRALCASGAASQSALCARFGISSGQMSRIVTRKRWAHIVP